MIAAAIDVPIGKFRPALHDAQSDVARLRGPMRMAIRWTKSVPSSAIAKMNKKDGGHGSEIAQPCIKAERENRC